MGGVAGINLPAFVERRWSPIQIDSLRPCVAGINLPAFVERGRTDCRACIRPSVAGINLPAFVERRPAYRHLRRLFRVSPGLTSRPSLSDVVQLAEGVQQDVSPGLTSRPSLSDRQAAAAEAPRAGVAGINLPAFVERDRRGRARCRRGQVSPGLTSRPSLSVSDRGELLARIAAVAGITSRLVKRHQKLTLWRHEN